MRTVVVGALVLVAACSFHLHGLDPSDGSAAGDDLAVASTTDLGAGDLAMGASTGDLATGATADLATPINGRRKSITIDKSKVTGTQTDFPVYIDLSDAQIAARARSDGHDIYFTAADGTTQLDHELQSWSSTTGRLQAWVRVPTLASSASTVLYVYYGDVATAPAPNAPGVFRSSFAAVWHLDDSAPATAIADATATHPGAPTLTTTTAVAAKLGQGLQFADSKDTITFTNPLSGNQAHTISVWVNQPSVNHVSAILVVGTPMQGQARWFYAHYTGPALAAGYFADDWTSNTNLDGAGWTLLHWVCEGANGKNHLYANGVEIPGSPQTLNNVNTTGTTGVIGHAPEPAYGNNMGLQGTIDELRIATVARAKEWVATEYANQSSPGTFYAVGAEELAP